MPAISPPITLKESTGTRVRRYASNAQSKVFKTPVCMCPPWLPSTAVLQGNMWVNAGQRYTCVSAGTTASGAGPTAKLAGGVTTDGSAWWVYSGNNIVTSDPNTTLRTWTTSLVVTAGQIYVVGGLTPGSKVYGVTISGTTSSSGTGPTGTGAGIVDGSATVTYMGVYQPSPYAQTAPILSFSSTAPTGYVQWATAIPNKSVSAQGVFGIVTKGVSNRVGDVITAVGGTFSVAATIRVTSVDASGGVTGASLASGGTYSQLSQSTVTQGSTTGSGSGSTYNLIWPEPSWMHINNGYLLGGGGGNTSVGAVANYNPAIGSAPKQRHISAQFQTDDPAPVFFWSSNGSVSNSQILYDDGNGWVIYNQDRLPITGGNVYIMLTFPAGRKMRRFRIETGWNSSSATLPAIYLNAASVPQKYLEPDQIKCALIADSLVDGNPLSPFSCGFHFANQLGYALDWNVFDFSQGGTGYLNYGGGAQVTTNNYIFRTSQVCAWSPDVVVLFGSTNDIGNTSGQVTTAVQAELNSLRTGGFTGPIFVWGVESVSASGLVHEGYLQTAVSTWLDPYNLTWFVPFSNADLPAIIGTYNNNPTPGGLTITGVNNFSTYINGSDSVHECEIAVTSLISYAVNYMKQNIFPYLS